MRRTSPLLLVVDEDDRFSTDLTRWLLQQGFNAVAAASYLEAMAVLGAVALDGIVGHLALRDGSLFALAQTLRAQRAAVVVGYSEVDVKPPPELDACFVRPLDLDVLRSFLTSRFGRRGSGEHVRIAGAHAVPAAQPPRLAARRRR